MTGFERHLLRFLQRRCDHSAMDVAADILQADNRPTMVTWCRTCGAVAVNDENAIARMEWRDMRRPEPTWR